jgi:8-oxo-dGTP diphosphatase
VKTIPKGERAWLARYRPEDFERPAVAVDVVILTVTDAELRALLILRDEPPFKGRWALPGGFLRVGKGGDRSLDDAAARELEEETGLSRARVTLAQLEAFGDEGRDPRTRVVSVAYVALVRPDLVPLVRGGGDAARAEWFSVDAPPRLAFDHERILARARAHISEQLQNTRVLRELVPPTFTIPELRAVWELVSDAPVDPRNFRRRVLRMAQDDILEEAPGKRVTASKPAQVWRFR